jgi:hypothetical protein
VSLIDILVHLSYPPLRDLLQASANETQDRLKGSMGRKKQQGETSGAWSTGLWGRVGHISEKVGEKCHFHDSCDSGLSEVEEEGPGGDGAGAGGKKQRQKETKHKHEGFQGKGKEEDVEKRQGPLSEQVMRGGEHLLAQPHKKPVQAVRRGAARASASTTAEDSGASSAGGRVFASTTSEEAGASNAAARTSASTTT